MFGVALACQSSALRGRDFIIIRYGWSWRGVGMAGFGRDIKHHPSDGIFACHRLGYYAE